MTPGGTAAFLFCQTLVLALPPRDGNQADYATRDRGSDPSHLLELSHAVDARRFVSAASISAPLLPLASPAPSPSSLLLPRPSAKSVTSVLQ